MWGYKNDSWGRGGGYWFFNMGLGRREFDLRLVFEMKIGVWVDVCVRDEL